MDVTCERCHTEYEFDDALVSEQGTSVRCTQCGHKFRVKKQGGTSTPEIWVVRTIDGRELEFRAIRDLKTAISGGRISRDDVLSRGVGRPRRLASIAELEPFFSGQAHLKMNTQIGLGEEPRARSVTPQGLGPPMVTEDSSPGRDHSVAIPLPSASQSEVTKQYPRALDPSRLDDELKKPGTTTSVLGTPSAAATKAALDAKASADKRATPAMGSLPVSRPPASRNSAVDLVSEREPVSVEPDTARKAPVETVRPPAPYPVGRGVGSTQPLVGLPAPTPLPPPARPPSREPSHSGALREGSPSQSSPPSNVASSASPVGAATPPVSAAAANSGATPSGGSAVATLDRAPSTRDGSAPALPASAFAEAPLSYREAHLPPPSEVEPSTRRREPLAETTASTPTPAPASTRTSQPALAEAPAPVSDAQQERRSSRESMDSVPPEPGMRRGSQTPTPSEVRYSMSNEDSTSSDPRFSAMASSRGASGATRLIVGVLVAGAVAFVLVLLVQRFVLKSPTKTETASDQRVASFLAEGEKNLAEGDLDGAKEQLDKASALGDSDPRVAKALARLANARADVPWLRLRLLAADDPERDSAKRDYADAADRARKAVDKAKALSTSDAEVVRAEVDQKRLAGDVSGARKLVDGMSSINAQPESSLVLGALDLAEEAPPWASVIDRLSKAAALETGLGRARALLVYALAMSGDPKSARTELGRLAALARPHPLSGGLRKFLDRVDKGETPPLRVDDLPSLTSSQDGGVASGDAIPGSAAAALKQALDARSHGDSHRAENLYQSVIDKDPNNSEALAGLAAIARNQGGTGRAIGLYQRVIDHNPNYVPAIMALADMKWDSGDRGAAAALYARAVELGSSEPRAKERTAGGAAPQPTSEPGSSTAAGSEAPPEAGATGGSAPPPQPTQAPTVDAPKEVTP